MKSLYLHKKLSHDDFDCIRGPYFTINFTFFLGARPQLNIIFVITKKDNACRLGTFLKFGHRIATQFSSSHHRSRPPQSHRIASILYFIRCTAPHRSSGNHHHNHTAPRLRWKSPKSGRWLF